jgi:hypothetical protein
MGRHPAPAGEKDNNYSPWQEETRIWAKPILFWTNDHFARGQEGGLVEETLWMRVWLAVFYNSHPLVIKQVVGREAIKSLGENPD